MKIINFDIGSKVYLKDQEYIVFKQLDLKSVIAINQKTNKKETLLITHLQREPEEESKHIYYEDIPDKDWEEAKKRLKIIQPILDKEKTKE